MISLTPLYRSGNHLQNIILPIRKCFFTWAIRNPFQCLGNRPKEQKVPMLLLKAKGKVEWSFRWFVNRPTKHRHLFCCSIVKFLYKKKTVKEEKELFSFFFSKIGFHPDATLTRVTQLAYGPSLGFPEAKVVQLTTSSNELCYDLLRLGVFCKEAIA